MAKHATVSEEAARDDALIDRIVKDPEGEARRARTEEYKRARKHLYDNRLSGRSLKRVK